MELSWELVDVNRGGARQNFIISENEWLKIKVSEDFVLQAKVPVGKRWTGDVHVMIDETDV